MKKLYFLLALVLIAKFSYAQSISSTINGTTQMSDQWAYPWYPSDSEYIAQGDVLTFEGTFEILSGNPVTELEIKLMFFDKSSGQWVLQKDWLADHSVDLTSGTFNEDFTIPSDAQNSADLTADEFYLLQVRVSYENEESAFANAYVQIDGNYVPTPIISPEAAIIEIYPNPVNQGQEFYVEYPSFEEGVTINVYNLAGVNVKSIKPTSNKTPVTADLKPGFYTVCITDGNNKTTKKLIVK